MDDERYGIDLKINPYDVELSNTIYEKEKARLNARCVDLLFVSPCTEPSQLSICFKVDFLHRRVRDFFSNTDALEHLIAARKDIAPDEFDPLVSLCRMNLALSKTLRFPEENETQFLLNQVFTLADSLMFYASQVESKAASSPTLEDAPSTQLRDVWATLDELDRTNEKRVSSLIGHSWVNAKDIPKGIFQEYRQKTWLAYAIQWRLSLYVADKIRRDPKQHLEQKKGRRCSTMP
jgi:hypothetical protein